MKQSDIAYELMLFASGHPWKSTRDKLRKLSEALVLTLPDVEQQQFNARANHLRSDAWAVRIGRPSR